MRPTHFDLSWEDNMLPWDHWKEKKHDSKRHSKDRTSTLMSRKLGFRHRGHKLDRKTKRSRQRAVNYTMLTIHSRTHHRLDTRRPGHPSKRPAWEASRQGRSKPPFNLWHKTNPPNFLFTVRVSNDAPLPQETVREIIDDFGWFPLEVQ
jgi:hypothetical protein